MPIQKTDSHKVALCFLLMLAVLLCGCAKNASQTATDASLHQVSAIEQQIKKQCPTAEINAPINALKASIQTQLAVCESEKSALKEKNNTLLAILVGVVAILIAVNWVKIKAKVLK